MEKKYFVTTTTKTILMENVYNPTFYRVDDSSDKSSFDNLCKEEGVTKFDTIESQLLELMRCRNPSLNEEQIKAEKLVEKYLADQDRTIENYGVWVYYPWKNQAVHILDEEEFIKVRTNRNKYKITQEEQELLRTKKIGIIGLSVGRAVATTIALERIAGEIRLADMDEIELSNLNRIKAPLTEMGLNKTIATAREIAELDPYIMVKCYTEGLLDSNMEEFFLNSGKLDLLIEECDDIGVKLKSRLECKKLGIPVVMETNDNCIIDIERYDLIDDLEIFHGKLSKEDINIGINSKTIEERLKIISKIIDTSKLSERMSLSIARLNKDLIAWPQLSSEVNYGAGVVAEISRKILLNEIMCSKQIRDVVNYAE